MLITLTRTGGFTGIPLKKTIDTTKLKKEEREKLEALLAKSHISNPKPQINTKYPASPDRFTYEISTQDGAISNTIKLDEQSLDPAIQELIKTLLLMNPES